MQRTMQVLLVLGCMFAVAFAQDKTPCDGANSDYVPDPESCCFYYQCTCDRGYRMPCPPGLEFNAVLKVCDWPYRANCSSGGQVVTPTPSPGGPILPCTSTDPQTIEYPGDCQKYYYCYEGYPYIAQCDGGEYYSEAAHACIKTDKCPSGGGGGTSFKCPDSVGTYPYPGDETKYYYCSNYIAYIVQCYTDQKYDESVRGCQPSA